MALSVTHGRRYDVIVIGAGHNGLTAAALLAKQGRKVLVLERRGILGGLAACEEFHPGYRSAGLLHDTAGIRPDVVDALDWKRIGSGRLSFTTTSPEVFAPQKDGGGLRLPDDPTEAAREIRAFSSRDADRYVEYRAFFSRMEKFTRRLFNEPPPDLANDSPNAFLQLAGRGLTLRRLGKKEMMEVLRMVPMCVADWLNEWFETELLKCLLAGPAIHGTCMGSWSPGSNANLLRYEATRGHRITNGPQALIDALEAAATSFGVTIRPDAAVQRIRISAGAVQGVTLSDGEMIDSRIVAASCDPKQTFLRLIAGQNLTTKLVHRIETFRASGVTAKINLALNAPFRFACRPDWEVEYARTAETLDEMERAFDAAKYGRFSPTPILDIHVPSVANPSFAPQGHSVVSILAHFAPYHLQGGWNEERKEALGDAVVRTLARYAPGIQGSIIAREVLSPVDIEARYATTGGNIFHGEHALDQLIVRPCPECARYETPIEGLYLCGSGSHPGGGLTCAPGSLAARTILKHRARNIVSTTRP